MDENAEYVTYGPKNNGDLEAFLYDGIGQHLYFIYALFYVLVFGSI